MKPQVTAGGSNAVVDVVPTSTHSLPLGAGPDGGRRAATACPQAGMIGPGLPRSALMQKGRRRFAFIRDSTIGVPLSLSDMDFVPNERMSQSHTQVVGLDHENHPGVGRHDRFPSLPSWM